MAATVSFNCVERTRQGLWVYKLHETMHEKV